MLGPYPSGKSHSFCFTTMIFFVGVLFYGAWILSRLKDSIIGLYDYFSGVPLILGCVFFSAREMPYFLLYCDDFFVEVLFVVFGLYHPAKFDL